MSAPRGCGKNGDMDDLEPSTSDLLSLENAVDGATRNALALHLSEAKVVGVGEVLVRLIERSDLANNRGTLVHALRHYDCAPYLPLLVDLVTTAGFEVAHEALEALQTIEHVQGSEVSAACEKVEGALGKGNLEDWRRPLLEHLLDMFD